MPDLNDGESAEVQGSARMPYLLKNVGGVFSCSCPAWRIQSCGIERRTCKHLRRYRGEQAEADRLGQLPASAPRRQVKTPPALLLAETWTQDCLPDGWWMSEKLDGVRAFWTGREFLSRQGNVFHAPAWFVARLPNVPLDGELWLARKAFQRTISIVRRQDQGDHWRSISYRVFDAPANSGSFEERLHYLGEVLPVGASGPVVVLEQQQCRDVAHLQRELSRIQALGGEGLMLREPGSRYEAGRSKTLLKIKTFHDAEAVVLGYQPGCGRHRGRLGALRVVLPGGTEFSVGTGFTDAQRERPPTIGSTITFRYQELTDGGVPRFPSFLRVRDND